MFTFKTPIIVDMEIVTVAVESSNKISNRLKEKIVSHKKRKRKWGN